MAGGAYEELSRTGQLGPESLEVLRRLVHQVRRSSGFPPPQGYAEWSNDAAYDVITAMLSREGAGQHFVTGCFAQASDEASLERLFLASVRNFLIDEAKKTPRGKLRRRIARLMGEDVTFCQAPARPPRWALSEHRDAGVWQGDLDALVAKAWRVRGVEIVRWNTSGPTPKATVQALKAVLTQVLRHAGAAVREEDLAKVLQARFALLAPASFVALAADGMPADPDTPAAALAGTEAPDAGGVAAGIWQQLTADERLVLPYLDEGAHHAAQLLEIGREQAAAILAGLTERLHLALADDSEQEAVLAALLRYCADPPPEPSQ